VWQGLQVSKHVQALQPQLAYQIDSQLLKTIQGEMRERREGPAKGRKRSLEAAAAAPRAVILHKLLQLLSALLIFSTKTERNEIKTFLKATIRY
jgi:hypothetical protein